MTPRKTSAPRKGSVSSYVHRLESLIDATGVLNSTFDLDRLLEIILNLTLRNLDAERGTIYLIDRERKELWSRVLTGTGMSEIRLPIGQGIAGAVASTGEVVNLKDVRKDPRFNAAFDKKTGFQTRTMLCKPMTNRSGEIVGVFQMLNKKSGAFNDEDIKFLEAFSDHAVLAIENARLHAASVAQERAEKELQIAAAIQQRLLPEKLPLIPGYDIAGTAIPSKAVGGDFYDVIPLDDGRFVCVMADVSGKGVPASLIVSTLQAFLSAYLENQRDPEKLVERLNDVAVQKTPPESFMTMVLVFLDPATHTFTYVNAGHNAPNLITAHSLEELPPGGLPLGMMEGMSYTAGHGTFPVGGTLVLYTDGLPEAMNAAKELYGNDRFADSMRSLVGRSSSDAMAKTLADIRAFVKDEPASDDITLLVLRRT